jgi:hypothetical protein
MLLPNISRKGFFGGFLALSVVIGISAGLPALGADEGSLDSMWMDQNQTPGAPKPIPAPIMTPVENVPVQTSPSAVPITSQSTEPEQKSPAAGKAAETNYSADSPVREALETAAPMCSLNEFKNSTLVSKGGWPGVGPFKPADSGTDFSDDNQNRVRVDVSSDKITRAEMTLTGKKLSGNQQKDLLDMQMNVDFLLEAVGIKPKKIQALNSEIEKNKEALLRADQTPLNLVTGRYSVSIEKRPSGSGIDYVVAVNSLDADKRIIKQHSLSETKPPTSTSDARYIFQDNANKTDTTNAKPPKPGSRPLVASPDTTAARPATASISKEHFAAVIGDWQKVKRVAVKNRQTEELASILSGKALARQMDAIKWLLTNKKFYEMNPKGVVVDQYTEISPSKKYAVMAQVREAYRFIDESTGKVIKEVDDINHVNYTIEKIGGKWLITDSSLLAPAKSATGKAAVTNSKTH